MEESEAELQLGNQKRHAGGRVNLLHNHPAVPVDLKSLHMALTGTKEQSADDSVTAALTEDEGDVLALLRQFLPHWRKDRGQLLFLYNTSECYTCKEGREILCEYSPSDS